jgi:hypothetical protein
MVVETCKRVIVEATDLSSTCFLIPLPATEGSETCPEELCSRQTGTQQHISSQ